LESTNKETEMETVYETWNKGAKIKETAQEAKDSKEEDAKATVKMGALDISDKDECKTEGKAK
jgi:hypothetical protein